MPHVNPPGSSPPPVSGSVEDPQHPETASYTRTFPRDAPDPGLPEEQSALDLVEVVALNRSSEQLNTGEEKSSGDDERACRNREEVVKEISISSTAFIGPACRPQPAIEDELSEFYKQLEQIDQRDAVDGNGENESQSCASSETGDGNSGRVSQTYGPADTIDGNNKYVSQSYRPPDSLDRTNERGSQSYAPPINPHERGNDHSYVYRPYPASWQQTDYRNTPQWRPQSYDMTRSNSYSYQNQWHLPPRPPPPNFPFCPPPQHGNPTHPQYSQPQGHECSQLGPDVRLGSSPSLAPYAPYEALERRQYEYEEQNYQDRNQQARNGDPALVLILMRGVPGSGKSTLARQISSRGPSGLILSTDDYFYQKDGYHFEPALLGAAHDWNQNRAKKAMLDGHTPVIIDNTNVQAWEMKPYVAVALETGYRVEFVAPDTSWKCDPVELEKRNHHGVSRESIVNMLDRFELPISVDIVMNSCEPAHKRKERHSRPYRHRR